MSGRLRVVFAGTPEFAVPCLQAVLGADVDCVAVYTQPDRPAGRGRQLQPSPVKQCALAAGIAVEQPATLKDDAVQAQLAEGAPEVKLLYPDDLPFADKIATIAREIYRAEGITLTGDTARQLKEFEKLGYGHLPVCIAKTQYSFSTDPAKIGAPTGHTLEVREVRLSAGAGFVVAVCGDIMTMPGLPKRPAALDIKLDDNGQIIGLA